MEGQNSDQMCPVCTLYLRPGMTLADHLFTHPKDQVIEALVRQVSSAGQMLSGTATINTNSQFTAITYRQFQTLTTNVPESSIPMMLNPCLVTQPNSPFTSGVIRSSVPLLSYPYYPPSQEPVQEQERVVENNTQCSYSFATQTTQTTQTNLPFVTQDSPFNEAECDEVHEIENPPENYQPTEDPFMNERLEGRLDPPKDEFVSTGLSNISEPREEIFINKITEIHKSTEGSLINNIHNQAVDPFNDENIEDVQESTIDPFVDDRINDVEDETQLNRREDVSSQVDHISENLIESSHNLGTVISNTHRLIANDPSLDYDQDLQADDMDYNDHPYENLSPGNNIGSPVSDVSNWSGSSIRVRRDLSNLDEQGNNHNILYVQPNSNAAEYVTSDPYDEGMEHHTSEAQLTNLDDMNYPVVFNYGTGHRRANLNMEDGENKEDNSVHSAPLNIHSDELMPPRGELSGQESLGATENSVWEVQDQEEPSYPLLDKERWHMLSAVQQENLTESYPSESALAERDHSVQCMECEMKFTCIRERRIHVQTVHKTPSHTQVKVEEEVQGRSNRYNKLGKAQIVKVKQERGLNIKTEANIKTCADCGLELQSLKQMRKHRREFHEVKRRCGTCDTVFKDNISYREHIANIHPIECNVCGKFFPTKSAANAHAKNHLKFKPYQCTVCDKSFISRNKLNDHNNIHSGDTPYRCSMCDQTFRHYSNLIQHKKFFHLKIKKKIKDYFCHCGEIFHSIKKLHWHKEIHDSKPKQCMYCSERYIHATSLTRHIRHAHDSTYLPKATRSLNVLCPVCKITCIRSSLAQHMKIHNGDKPFTCNVCSKEFTTNWNLQMHKWTHASRNSKPYKCKQCKCAFYMQSSYQAHLRSHRNIRPYTCNYCGRQFIRKYNCVRHVKEHETNKSYCCAVCNKTFHRSYYLTEHMRTHTGVKPYTCHICSKTSSTKSNHNKHVRTHHAREPVNTEG